MLYLLYVLTFLAGILFYIMSPRDDQVNLDTYRAEGFIVSFLSQHQAAKDYMTQWLGFDLKHDTGGADRAAVSSFSLANNKFISFSPNGAIIDMSHRQGLSSTAPALEDNGIKMGPDNDGNYRFLTSVFCLTNAEPPAPTLCGSNNAQKNYLVTYSGSTQRLSWWPKEYSNRQRRYGTWRTAITRRTNGSYNCGVLVTTEVGGTQQWCVDNGQTVKLPNNQCAQKVPDAIINALCPGNPSECLDALFCISRIKTGPQRYYVADGLVSFYDGINNQNTGADGDRSEGNIPWEDLMRDNQQAGTTVANPNADFSSEKIAAASGVIFPNLPIVSGGNTVFHDFTLTVLLKGDPNSDMDTVLELVNDIESPWEVSLHFEKPSAGHPQAYFMVNGDPKKINNLHTPPVLQNLDPTNKIISLTIIGSNDKLNVYINAKSDPIATLEATEADIQPYLTIGHLNGKNHLLVYSATNSAFIYGVRYYNRAFGTTERIKTASGFTPSELEQNFKLDSKRYGIGVHSDYNPSIH